MGSEKETHRKIALQIGGLLFGLISLIIAIYQYSKTVQKAYWENSIVKARKAKAEKNGNDGNEKNI